MSRALRRWIARLMMGLLLVGQFAMASHACSAAVAPPVAHAAALHDGVPCPDAVPEPASPADTGTALCAGHCQADDRSADHTPAPTVLPALLNALYTLAAAAGRPPEPEAAAPPPPPQAAPPLAILHCCLRN
jgi:hypothetical protein